MKKLSIAMGCAGLLSLPPAYGADAKKGGETFETTCSVCHNADSTEAKIGPGLKGLYKKAALNNKKRPSDATVSAMIKEGGNGMPGFGDQLTPAEMLDLLAYLKTL